MGKTSKTAASTDTKSKICCADPANISGYRAVNRTGWADYCKKCGRTWPATPPTMEEMLPEGSK